MTMRAFLQKWPVTCTAVLVASNPHMDDMPRGSSHYRVTLRHARKQMLVYFSHGPAICKEPDAAHVLDCLASDCAGYANARSFEDWCGEYGYDMDNRKAERTYAAIGRQYAQLSRLLPAAAFDALLWNVERG